MEKAINERFIRFSPKSARIPYPDDLELGNDITVTFNGGYERQLISFQHGE